MAYNKKFDFDEFLKTIQDSQPLLRKQKNLTTLIKNLIISAKDRIRFSYNTRDISNSHNVKSKKTIKSINSNFKSTLQTQVNEICFIFFIF